MFCGPAGAQTACGNGKYSLVAFGALSRFNSSGTLVTDYTLGKPVAHAALSTSLFAYYGALSAWECKGLQSVMHPLPNNPAMHGAATTRSSLPRSPAHAPCPQATHSPQLLPLPPPALPLPPSSPTAS